MEPFPPHIKHFITQVKWTYARTMPLWPYEYIVRSRVDESLFVEMVQHIREHGYQGFFYKRPITYFDEDGMTYWTMGEPLDQTVIINRCLKENTYEERLKNGTNPKNISPKWLKPITHPTFFPTLAPFKTLIFFKPMLLKELLQSKGLKQKWLAGKMGVSEVTVSNWCSGKSVPTKTHFKELSKLLNVQIKNIIRQRQE